MNVDNKFRRVCVVGLGYIGLPTACMIASSGIEVFGYDINTQIVEEINLGQAHIEEPGLPNILKSVLEAKTFHASTELESCDLYLIAVPTPFDHAQKTADISYVKSALSQIAHIVKQDCLIIIESTCPVGATEELSNYFHSERAKIGDTNTISVGFAYCPERVIPGNTLHELRYNARVIGGLTKTAGLEAKTFYEKFILGDCKLVEDARTAEFIKLSENTFRDVNIAFANELGALAEELDVNAQEVIKMCNLHPRVNILQPGPGVGGHCIAVDPWFLIKSSQHNTQLMKTARMINDAKPDKVVQKIQEKRIAISKPVLCLGLTYKADIGDFRESPSLSIYSKLRNLMPEEVFACDPYANDQMCNDPHILPHLPDNVNEYLVVGLVPHSEFKGIQKLSDDFISIVSFE
jgi:UDP-N-acetyl-D-mannosaminuronic acid dehydrogenase